MFHEDGERFDDADNYNDNEELDPEKIFGDGEGSDDNGCDSEDEEFYWFQ